MRFTFSMSPQKLTRLLSISFFAHFYTCIASNLLMFVVCYLFPYDLNAAVRKQAGRFIWHPNVIYMLTQLALDVLSLAVIRLALYLSPKLGVIARFTFMVVFLCPFAWLIVELFLPEYGTFVFILFVFVSEVLVIAPLIITIQLVYLVFIRKNKTLNVAQLAYSLGVYEPTNGADDLDKNESDGHLCSIIPLTVVVLLAIIMNLVYYFGMGHLGLYGSGFQFGTQDLPQFVIAHSSGDYLGPGSTSYTIRRTCGVQEVNAFEIDVRLTADHQLVGAHEEFISSMSNDKQVFFDGEWYDVEGKRVSDLPLDILRQINVGARWVEVDPFGVFKSRLHSKEERDAILAQTLEPLSSLLETTKNFCKFDDGSYPEIMFDPKDEDDDSTLTEELHLIFNEIVSATTVAEGEESEGFENTRFLISCNTPACVSNATATIYERPELKNVSLLLKPGLLNHSRPSVEAVKDSIAYYNDHIANSYKMQSMHEYPFNIWTAATPAMVKYLRQTGASGVTSDLATMSEVTPPGDTSPVFIVGGGYFLLYFIAISLVQIGALVFVLRQKIVEKRNSDRRHVRLGTKGRQTLLHDDEDFMTGTEFQGV